MRRLLLPILLIAAGVSAPSAQAGWKVDRAQAIAEHVWNYNYGCDDGVVIRWADPRLAFSRSELGADLARGREVLAWVTPTAADRCAVYFNAPWKQRWGLSFTEICSTMIHEYGHLAGYISARGVREPDGTVDHSHSPNPRSIMYPDYRPNRRCRKHGRPYLDRYNLL